MFQQDHRNVERKRIEAILELLIQVEMPRNFPMFRSFRLRKRQKENTRMISSTNLSPICDRVVQCKCLGIKAFSSLLVHRAAFHNIPHNVVKRGDRTPTNKGTFCRYFHLLLVLLPRAVVAQFSCHGSLCARIQEFSCEEGADVRYFWCCACCACFVPKKSKCK